MSQIIEQVVEVFRTDVEDPIVAKQLISLLHKNFPGGAISFDLEDCDKVLRMEGAGIVPEKVLRLLRHVGCTVSLLD